MSTRRGHFFCAGLGLHNSDRVGWEPDKIFSGRRDRRVTVIFGSRYCFYRLRNRATTGSGYGRCQAFLYEEGAIMKPLVIATLVVVCGATDEGGKHAWTLKNGETLNATFSSYHMRVITVEVSAGTTVDIPIYDLVLSDRERAATLAYEAAMEKQHESDIASQKTENEKLVRGLKQKIKDTKDELKQLKRVIQKPQAEKRRTKSKKTWLEIRQDAWRKGQFLEKQQERYKKQLDLLTPFVPPAPKPLRLQLSSAKLGDLGKLPLGKIYYPPKSHNSIHRTSRALPGFHERGSAGAYNIIAQAKMQASLDEMRKNEENKKRDELSRQCCIRVFQIKGPEEMLCVCEQTNKPIYFIIRGISTAGLTNDSPLETSADVFEITDTKTYPTTIGGTNTVFVLQPLLKTGTGAGRH